MPTYEYECDACGHGFEQFQPITAAALRKCPRCAKPRLRRLIGAGGGVIFKGAGFYQTDYRSESYRKAADAEQKAATGTPTGKFEKPAGEQPATGGAEADAPAKPAAENPAPAAAAAKQTGTRGRSKKK
jgi:putative FmdB family regulatory protein